MIAIIDYGLGNISNVTRAIQHLGYDVILTCDDKDVQKLKLSYFQVLTFSGCDAFYRRKKH